jgi:hypothetical protein
MKQISIEWEGEEFTIDESEAFLLGERLEDIVTLPELALMAQRPKFRKLARCYAEMLNFAGARVSAEKVHTVMMKEIKSAGKADQQIMVSTAIATLIEILMDGAPEDGQSDGKKKTSHLSKVAS